MLQFGHLGDVAGEGIVATAGLAEEVAGPTAHVGQQVTHGHRTFGRLVRQPQVGEIGLHRLVQIDLTALHQRHNDGAGDGLGRRADLKQGVGRHRQRVFHAGDAEPRQALAALVVEADGHAGDSQPPHLGHDVIAQPGEVDIVCLVMNGDGDHV